jgi:FixJ family two-component response regulator
LSSRKNATSVSDIVSPSDSSPRHFSSKQIASRLGLSIRTIEAHRTHLFRKLDVRSVVGLVRYAIHYGIIEP